MAIESTSQTLGTVIAKPKDLISPDDWQIVGRLLAGPLAALMFWSLPLGLEPLQHKALAITIFMIINWIAEPCDHGLTALTGCYLYWALHVSKFSVAFSGFTNSTTWFLFCSLLMAEAASRSGLAKRLGYLFMRRAGTSCHRIQISLILLMFVLTFFVPSGLARLGLLASLTVGLAKAFGLDKQSNFIRGLFLMITTTGYMMDGMVLSGAATMLTRGMVEEQTGIQMLWSQWLFACLPLILVTMIATIVVTRWLFPAESKNLSGDANFFKTTLDEMGPWSAAEKKTLLWFVLAMALWGTDFLHHINPAVIGMGVGIAFCLPKFGVLDPKAAKGINFFTIIFSAGALSMGAVLVDSNVLPLLTGRLLTGLQPFVSNPFTYALALYLAAFAYHFGFAYRPTMLVTSFPLVLSFATAHGLNIVPTALLWTIGGGGGLFIYQSGVYVLGYSYGFFSTKDFFKFGLLMTLVQAAALALIVPYYWPLIGLNWLK